MKKYRPDYNAIIPMELPAADYRESGGSWTVGHFVGPGASVTQRYRTPYVLQQRWLIRTGEPYLSESPAKPSDHKLVDHPYGTYHPGDGQVPGHWTPAHVFCSVRDEWRDVEKVVSLMGEVLY